MKGGEAEQYAAEFLQRQHLVLLERNYRCRFGEIGLIMRYGVTLVFIEVRMRTSQFFGGAAASNHIIQTDKTATYGTALSYWAKISTTMPL